MGHGPDVKDLVRVQVEEPFGQPVTEDDRQRLLCKPACHPGRDVRSEHKALWEASADLHGEGPIPRCRLEG